MSSVLGMELLKWICADGHAAWSAPETLDLCT